MAGYILTSAYSEATQYIFLFLLFSFSFQVKHSLCIGICNWRCLISTKKLGIALLSNAPRSLNCVHFLNFVMLVVCMEIIKVQHYCRLKFYMVRHFVFIVCFY